MYKNNKIVYRISYFTLNVDYSIFLCKVFNFDTKYQAAPLCDCNLKKKVKD